MRHRLRGGPCTALDDQAGCALGDVQGRGCRIVRTGNEYVLIDGGSPSGTYVNDERVEGPRRLRSGDLISLGRARLRFGERQKRQ